MDSIREEVGEISSELRECDLSDASKEVGVDIAGFVTKKLSQKSKCPS